MVTQHIAEMKDGLNATPTTRNDLTNPRLRATHLLDAQHDSRNSHSLYHTTTAREVYDLHSKSAFRTG